jgi:hypothetical protein
MNQEPNEHPEGYNPFGEVIYSYSRAQALEDGVLINCTELAKEAGFVIPVALTQALHATIGDIPEPYSQWQDYTGRLWDLLWMTRCAVRAKQNRHDHDIEVVLIMQTPENVLNPPHHITVRANCGPGDLGEPVITIGFPQDF